jgi:hypothetical protein
MTTRATVALWIIGAGLAVAALAGVPLLLEARVAGAVVMMVGSAGAVAGIIVLLTAIPEQRIANARERISRRSMWSSFNLSVAAWSSVWGTIGANANG